MPKRVFSCKSVTTTLATCEEKGIGVGNLILMPKMDLKESRYLTE